MYAKQKKVVQRLMEKVYSRAIRALYLVKEALTVFLKTNEASKTADKDVLKAIYSSVQIDYFHLL